MALLALKSRPPYQEGCPAGSSVWRSSRSAQQKHRNPVYKQVSPSLTPTESGPQDAGRLHPRTAVLHAFFKKKKK